MPVLWADTGKGRVCIARSRREKDLKDSEDSVVGWGSLPCLVREMVEQERSAASSASERS